MSAAWRWRLGLWPVGRCGRRADSRPEVVWPTWGLGPRGVWARVGFGATWALGPGGVWGHVGPVRRRRTDGPPAAGAGSGVGVEVGQVQRLQPVADGDVQLRELARPDQDPHAYQHRPSGADHRRVMALDHRQGRGRRAE